MLGCRARQVVAALPICITLCPTEESTEFSDFHRVREIADWRFQQATRVFTGLGHKKYVASRTKLRPVSALHRSAHTIRPSRDEISVR